MSTETKIPFQLTPSGAVAILTDPTEQQEQHIEALVATEPGERVILAGYGVAVRHAVFSPNDEVIAQVLRQDVTSSMAVWEPNITVVNVTSEAIVGLPEDQANIKVNWIPKNQQNPSNSGVLTATVLVGGQVV